MIDLKALPHTETLVPITITRLGEERSTRYQISPTEANRPTRINYQAIADAMTQELMSIHKEREHADSIKTEEG